MTYEEIERWIFGYNEDDPLIGSWHDEAVKLCLRVQASGDDFMFAVFMSEIRATYHRTKIGTFGFVVDMLEEETTAE